MSIISNSTKSTTARIAAAILSASAAALAATPTTAQQGMSPSRAEFLLKDLSPRILDGTFQGQRGTWTVREDLLQALDGNRSRASGLDNARRGDALERLIGARRLAEFESRNRPAPYVKPNHDRPAREVVFVTPYGVSRHYKGRDPVTYSHPGLCSGKQSRQGDTVTIYLHRC
jgi:hypothetical protein